MTSGRPRPRFSVIVPAFNAQVTLKETLDAIQAQVFEDWECLIVDDGSIDETARIAAEFSAREPRSRVLRQPNQGTAGAYNTGATTARGEFIVICSADDVLLPDHLDAMSSFIDEQPGYDIYSSNGYYWWPDDVRQPAYPPGYRDEIHSLKLSDVIQNCFYSVGATYRRELIDTGHRYRPGIYGEDYDFWLRTMAAGARHRYLPKALSLHRVSRQQKSARLETVYRSDIRLVTDLREAFRLGPDEERAIEETVRNRQQLIAELARRPGVYRRLIRPALARTLVRLVGYRRARRLHSRITSSLGRLRGRAAG